ALPSQDGGRGGRGGRIGTAKPISLDRELRLRKQYGSMTTSAQEKTGPSATVDLAGLKRFLDERKLGDTGALRSENISLGHSNEVHLIHFDGHSWALRRPPRGPLL